ncbi:hypothetical protein Nepgr_009739 [Nepenthes gracilis]|uniref:Uncharacterized protein n=1 Tax=Nepenthes gracilis TaxID=150966 RepID=A0AAD3SBV9_NEPGR|nr:hypothetical protein Nepgr_009739 [Nepenthes gracilis]
MPTAITASFMPAIIILFSILLLSPTMTCIGHDPKCFMDAVTPRPSVFDSRQYTTLHGRRDKGFGAKEVETSLPKGFRRSSTPSRYVNYRACSGDTP